jgi:hypothetical protein
LNDIATPPPETLDDHHLILEQRLILHEIADPTGKLKASTAQALEAIRGGDATLPTSKSTTALLVPYASRVIKEHAFPPYDASQVAVSALRMGRDWMITNGYGHTDL